MPYTPYSYANMLVDRVRTDAYLEAMRQTIRPGMTVLDLGAGTGFFAIMACRMGAARAYAIEYNDAITLGPKMAEEAGFADRIEFFHAKSGDVTLPDRVDLIIHDMRAALPPCYGNLSVIGDARDRFLREGGIMMPLRDELHLVPVHAPKLHAEHVRPWHLLGVETPFDCWAAHNASSYTKQYLGAEHFGMAPQRLTMIDWTQVRGETFNERRRFEVSEARLLHGLYIWFTCDLTESVSYDSGTGGSERVYGHAWFPWPNAVAVAVGDTVDCRVAIRALRDNYLWIWETTIRGADGTRRQRFEQSDFHGWALPPRDLQPLPPDRPVQLSVRQREAAWILAEVAAGFSLATIADRLQARSPSDHPTHTAALRTVESILRRNDR